MWRSQMSAVPTSIVSRGSRWHHRPVDARAQRIAGTVGLFIAAPAIAAIDLLTGLEFSFSIFYVIPPVVASWYLGARIGVLVALVTGLSWAYAESVARPAGLSAALWNRGTRILVLVAFTYLIDLVHRNQQELRRLLVQRDEFLALVAHELRAPVAAIEIVATGLARGRPVEDRERRALEQMRDQARGLTALAESLLAVGKLESHKSTPEREDVDLRALLVTIAESTPRLRLTAPMNPVVVAADRDVLRRALTNVVDNALKFSEPSETVELDLQAADAHAAVRVIDHGIGMAAGDLAGLFRKYGRLPAAKRFAGIGLGLYYAQLALRAHGGAITASSAGPGRGTTFELRLPLAGGAAGAARGG
jgi:signal transduction histidine kinase